MANERQPVFLKGLTRAEATALTRLPMYSTLSRNSYSTVPWLSHNLPTVEPKSQSFILSSTMPIAVQPVTNLVIAILIPTAHGNISECTCTQLADTVVVMNVSHVWLISSKRLAWSVKLDVTSSILPFSFGLSSILYFPNLSVVLLLCFILHFYFYSYFIFFPSPSFLAAARDASTSGQTNLSYFSSSFYLALMQLHSLQ